MYKFYIVLIFEVYNFIGYKSNLYMRWDMRKIAIIDIGSNTIRMSLFNVEGEEFYELLNKKTTAGLASYVKKGFLSRDGI